MLIVENYGKETENAIVAGDRRRRKINVARPHFLDDHDLPDAPDTVLYGQPIAATPLAVHSQATVVLEEQVSSSHTLDEEIDQFQLEDTGRPQGTQFVVLSDEEEKATEASGIAGFIVARPEDGSEEDMDRMQDLLTKRGAKVAGKKTGASQVPPSLPPPPPPAEPKLPAEDPKKKRKGDIEGTISKDPKKPRQQPPPVQQQKLDKGKGRARSVESGEIRDEAEVRRAPVTWSPDLRLDGAPISCQSSIRAVQQGHAHHLAEVLERPLLLPKDMETLEKMSQPQLFLSLKRDLALAIQEVFVAEKFIEDTRKKARTELEIRMETEKSLGTALAENEKLVAEVADLKREKNGVESNLKTMKTQIEGQRKLLREKDDELSRAQRERSDLEKELALMKEEASSFQRSLQTAKQTSYEEGVATTEEQLTEAFAALFREYCQKIRINDQ
ncbi:uncharacterized protein LOC142639784 [Castanea sativa]|uniref:uncharacterized protein LOC142639784 n=1 Tax=Castanea sativa TaxID=21020 RepID=UPI003F64DF4C